MEAIYGRTPRRFGHAFVEKLAGAVFPSTLRSLKFGDNFNQMLGVLFFLLTGWGVYMSLHGCVTFLLFSALVR